MRRDTRFKPDDQLAARDGTPQVNGSNRQKNYPFSSSFVANKQAVLLFLALTVQVHRLLSFSAHFSLNFTLTFAMKPCTHSLVCRQKSLQIVRKSRTCHCNPSELQFELFFCFWNRV